MAEEKLLTVREVSQLLGISERQVIDLAENGSIPAYKVGGVYLRFKRPQVEDFRRKFGTTVQVSKEGEYTLPERIKDFFYFNDFYLLSFLAVILLIFVIFKG